ncbi:VOC family protein [Delftia acidovorans]
MPQVIGQVSVAVRDYDEALRFYAGALGFVLIEDTVLSEGKRWVTVAPVGGGVRLLLARATNEEQAARVGNQTGGRVFLFLQTDDCLRDFEAYRSRGVRFVQDPQRKPHGTVAVFEDLYGNLWDLIEPHPAR